MPYYFIKAAELCGMLPDITRIIIEKSFQFFRDKPLEFSINIGEQELNDCYLLDFLTHTAHKYGIPASNVDYIKIDGSFIKNIDNNVSSYKIAQTIAQFAQNIDAKVIAEFVHSPSVYQKVLELGIDYTQGYYIGEPKPAEWEESKC